MRWLITGGCGFVGVNLIARLRGTPGVSLRVLDDLSVGTRADLARVATVVAARAGEVPDVELVVGDVRDAEVVRGACDGCDIVVHLAARTGVLPSLEDPRGDFEVNVAGTFNVLEAARAARVPRVVLASSGAPVGDQPPPFHEALPVRPLSPYGAAKACGEAYAHAYAASLGVAAVALRFSNVYGPRSGRKGSVVARFIGQALAGETLRVYGDGSQTRDFLFVDDLCGAIEAAARAPDPGRLLQIASGHETSLRQLVDLLGPLLEAQAGVRCQVAYEDFRQGEIRRNYASVERVRAALGWSASTSLADGLARTVQWFVDERAHPGA